ncbi:glycosyltransferase [Candidatus Dojkabacteria bacterium]|nr:glycosyltransferase [Candidatus Dojkabacteria bacterium]
MKIGINLMGEPRLRAGTGRFAYELIDAISRIENEHTWIIFCPSAYANSLKLNEKFTVVSVQCGESTISRRITEQVVLPFKARQHSIDYMFSTNNIAPVLLGRKNCPAILDTARWRFPNPSKRLNELVVKLFVRLTAKASSKIVTISDFSKSEIIDLLGVEAEKVQVITLGVNLERFRCPRSDEVQDTIENFLGEENLPYLMIHSSLQARKNHLRLLRAFKKSGFPGKLVIVGKESDQLKPIVSEISRLKLNEKVLLLGFLDDDVLIQILSKCFFYVFPSLYEGAGLTPLEAMACGRAVLASNIPPIKEYCNNNFYAVNPNNVNSIAEGIKMLYTNDNLRADFEKRGREFVKKYDWTKTAKQLIDILEK